MSEKQIPDRHAERGSERPELADADLTFATLDEADDRSVETCGVRQFLLANPPFDPKLADSLPERS